MGDGQTSPRKSLLGPVKDIEIVGGDTIRINLSEPWFASSRYAKLFRTLGKTCFADTC